MSFSMPSVSSIPDVLYAKAIKLSSAAYSAASDMAQSQDLIVSIARVALIGYSVAYLLGSTHPIGAAAILLSSTAVFRGVPALYHHAIRNLETKPELPGIFKWAETPVFLLITQKVHTLITFFFSSLFAVDIGTSLMKIGKYFHFVGFGLIVMAAEDIIQEGFKAFDPAFHNRPKTD